MIEDKAQSLGEVLNGLMENVISKRQKSNSQLTEAWSRLLPQQLSGHCEITEFSSGVVMVKTDGPAYWHELRLCKKELVKELNRHLSGARVRDIKMAV